MTEVYHVHEEGAEYWGSGQVICYDCNPRLDGGNGANYKDVEGKVLAGIGSISSEIDALTQVQVDYLLTVAEIHQQTTDHDVRVYTFART